MLMSLFVELLHSLWYLCFIFNDRAMLVKVNRVFKTRSKFHECDFDFSRYLMFWKMMISCIKKIISSNARCCFSYLARKDFKMMIRCLYSSYSTIFRSARLVDDKKIDSIDSIRWIERVFKSELISSHMSTVYVLTRTKTIHESQSADLTSMIFLVVDMMWDRIRRDKKKNKWSDE